MVLDEHLTWKPHVAHVANKISKSIGIIRRASPYLQKSSLQTLYFSMIHPYLQYCSLVWSSTYPTNLSRLVVLQKRVVRIINKSDFLAHTSPIVKELHLLKLQDIRILQIYQFIFSFENKKLPYKFQEMFTLNSQIHNYNTRSKHLLHIPPVRTNYRQFSIRYQGPTLFNSLSNELSKMHPIIYLQRTKGTIDLKLLTQIIIM